MYQLSVFGGEYPVKKTKAVYKGYAATPGTGELGKQCRNCKYARIMQSHRTYCAVTDRGYIRLRADACLFFIEIAEG